MRVCLYMEGRIRQEMNPLPENHIRMLIRREPSSAPRPLRRGTERAFAGELRNALASVYPRFHSLLALAFCANVLLCLLHVPAFSAVVGEIWSSRLDIPAVTATLADLDGDDTLELVVATTDRLYVYIWSASEGRYTKELAVDGFPAPISALAAADTTGSGRHDLWVGMQGSGSIQLYSLDGHTLMNRGTIGRLWNSIRTLLTLDADGDGQEDLLALGNDGVGVLYRNDGGAFREVWRTPSGEGPGRFVTVGPYIDGERPTVIIGKAQGSVAIYQWRDGTSSQAQGGTLVKRFENYPWGVIGAMDLVVDGSGRGHLYVATGQNLLYRYSWQDAGSLHTGQWPQYVVNTTEQLQALHFPEITPTWIGLHEGKLQAWRLSSGGLSESWSLTEPLAWLQQTQSGHLITFSTDRLMRVLGQVDDGYLRIQRGGRGHKLLAPALLDGDELYLSADDLKAIMGWRAWNTREGSRWVGVAPLFQFFIVDAGAETASVNGRAKPLSAPARMHEGRLYIPVSFVTLLGYEYTWEGAIRSLTFE